MASSAFIQEWPENKLTVAELDALMGALFDFEMRTVSSLSPEYESARDKLGSALASAKGEL